MEKVFIITRYISERMTEPSTYAGISSMALLARVPQDNVDAFITSVSFITGLASIFIQENKKNASS